MEVVGSSLTASSIYFSEYTKDIFVILGADKITTISPRADKGYVANFVEKMSIRPGCSSFTPVFII